MYADGIHIIKPFKRILQCFVSDMGKLVSKLLISENVLRHIGNSLIIFSRLSSLNMLLLNKNKSILEMKLYFAAFITLQTLFWLIYDSSRQRWKSYPPCNCTMQKKEFQLYNIEQIWLLVVHKRKNNVMSHDMNEHFQLD